METLKFVALEARHFRTFVQLSEALGSTNQWYCSQYHKCCVTDPDRLWEYYVRSGGAADFARRYAHAMGPQNKWYCSQFYRRDVQEEKTLWEYYVKFAPPGALGIRPRPDADKPPSDINMTG